DGPITQAELAERMDIEPATLVSVLGRMLRDGWVTREDCPTDRRKKLVRPTPAAGPIWEQGVECARRVRAQISQGFSPEHLELLKQMLSQVGDNLLAVASSNQAEV